MDIAEILGKLGFDLQVFIFNTVNILLLLFLLKKFIVTPVLAMVEERKKIIHAGFQKEEEARLALERAQAEAKNILNLAVVESEEILNKAKQQGNKQTEQILEQAQKQADKILASADEEIQMREKSMMQRAKNRLADMVTVATSKVYKS